MRTPAAAASGSSREQPAAAAMAQPGQPDPAAAIEMAKQEMDYRVNLFNA